MNIQCTKKLLDELKIKPDSNVEEHTLASWHANVLTIRRRKTVVLVNDKNRYVVVLHGLKAKDFKQFIKLIPDAIRKTLQEENVRDEVIEQFLEQAKTITFSKTKDRTSVARLNKSCESVEVYQDLIDDSSLYQPKIGKEANAFLVGDGKNKYLKPNETMFKDLEELTGKKAFQTRAIVLNVRLDMERHDIWRRIVVPANFTFHKLHEIFQIAFNWQDYHLHEFYIYSEKRTMEFSINHSAYHKDRFKPLVNLVCDQESFAYIEKSDVKAQLDTEVKLSDYMPANGKYIYDFGDNWQHYFEVESEINDYDKNYPVCLSGDGNAPPEDVGGEYGYEEFLKILGNKGDPNHRDMVRWGTSNGFNQFDLGMVNFRLMRM